MKRSFHLFQAFLVLWGKFFASPLSATLKYALYRINLGENYFCSALNPLIPLGSRTSQLAQLWDSAKETCCL